jgi:NAD(P)H-hydrate repair Nnr-like enzyme with NAD(P)H-hydrate dehydratase domain
MSATLKSFHIFSFPWSEVAPTVTKIIPPLLHTEHKGAMGRIGVLGGSKDYTGAPFYAADAALKFGGDLSTVLSSQLASIPIKCYSPELIVTPFYRDDCFEFFDYTTATAEKFCSSPSSASKTTRQEADMMAQSEVNSVTCQILPSLCQSQIFLTDCTCRGHYC